MTDHRPNPQLLFITAGITTALNTSLLAPLERVKLLLQTQDANPHISKDKRFKGIIDVFRRIPKEEGFAAFWRGNFPAIIRYFPAQATRFIPKEQLKKMATQYDPKTDYWKFTLVNFAAGGAAGLVSLLFTYPFDYARTRLAADVGRSVIDRQFTGMTDCFAKTLKTDGIFGLYRGLFISFWGIIAYRAFYFGLYDTMKTTKGSFVEKFLLAQGVTITAGIVTYPFDTVRRRLMMQSGLSNKLYNGTIDCISKMYQIEGGRGFFKGYLMNLLKSFSGAITLVGFDMLKH